VQAAKVLKNVFSNYVNVAVGGIAGLILTPLLFHYLRPTNYGALAFALVASAAIEAIDLGMTNSLVRYVSVLSAKGQTTELRELVSSAFFFLLAIGLSGTVLLAGLSSFLAKSFHLRADVPRDAILVIALVGLCVSMQLPSAALAAHLMGCQDFVLRNAADISTQLVRLILIIILVVLGSSLVAIALVYPLVSLLRLLSLLAAVYKSSIPTLPRLSSAKFRHLRKISGFASLSFIEDLATRYYFLADSLLTARFLPLSDLANLTVCRRFPNALRNFAQQPLWVAYPLVSSAWSRGDRKALKKFMLVSTRTLLACVVPLTAAMFIWAEPILRYWIGPSILTEISVFRAFVIFGFFASIESGPLTLLYGMGRIGFSTALILFLLATLVLAGFWVVPKWGLFGLAALFASVYGSGTFLLFGKAMRLADLRFRNWVRKGVIPVIVPSIISVAWFCIGYVLLGSGLAGLIMSVVSGLFLHATLLLVAASSGNARSLSNRIQEFFTGMDEI
jgi:O-antigen/teichoic acid export membrane protein